MERMWREVDENGWIFGGSEPHLGIVGASTLKSGGPMGEVDLERLLDGGWSCLAVRAVKELCGLVWSRTEMAPVVVSGGQSPCSRIHIQAHRNTLPPPWACTICWAEPIRHGANQHVDGGGGDVVQLCEISASTTDNAKRVGFIEDEAVLIPLLGLELGTAISKQ